MVVSGYGVQRDKKMLFKPPNRLFGQANVPNGSDKGAGGKAYYPYFHLKIQRHFLMQDGETLSSDPSLDNGPFYHGTKADLQIGDLLTPGFRSNYRPEIVMNHIYFTALSNGAAGLAAALAPGDGRERIYIVEPTGSFENDPNVTDKKFPGNPTRSYRSRAPLRNYW